MGMGLSIPLESFALDISAGPRIGLAIATRPMDDADHWYFWQLQPFPGHLAAVCVAHDPGTAPTLHFRRVVPLRSDAIIQYRLLRRSFDCARQIAMQPSPCTASRR